jgi:hypothetical protein
MKEPAGWGPAGGEEGASKDRGIEAHPWAPPTQTMAAHSGLATVAGGRTASVTTAARYRQRRSSEGGVGGAAWGEENQGTTI